MQEGMCSCSTGEEFDVMIMFRQKVEKLFLGVAIWILTGWCYETVMAT